MSEGDELPEGWARLNLAELGGFSAPIVYGIIQAGPHVPEGVPYVRPTEMSNDGQISTDVLRTSEEIAARYVRSKLQEGDVVLSIVGSIGKVAIVPKWLAGGNLTQSSARIRPPEWMSPRFLAHALRSPQTLKQYEEMEFGNAVRRLNLEHVRAVSLPLPPLPEQRRIVAKLDSVLAKSRRAREALDAIPPLLEQLRQSTLAAAFRGDLTADWRAKNPDVEPASELLKRIRVERRQKWEAAELAKLTAKGKTPTDDRWKAKYVEPEPVDDSELPELPKGWCWASVDQICSLITSGSRAWSQYYGRGTGTFVLAQNVKPGKLDLTQRQQVDPPEHDAERARTLICRGDVLITIVGANTGDVCQVDVDLVEHYVCQSVALLRPIYAGWSSSLMLFLNATAGGRRQLDEFMYGQGRPHLGFDQIRTVAVPLPPEAERERLEAAIRRAFIKIDELGILVGRARADRDSLEGASLAKAFRGELVPQDPNDEPAAVMLERLRAERAAKTSPPRGAKGRANSPSPRGEGDTGGEVPRRGRPKKG